VIIGLAVALGLAAAPDAADLATRMRESAAAAQTLQGPLDGTWTLWDAHHRRLFVLQITDPAGGGPLAGAWRGTGASAAAGLIDAIARHGDHLEIRFARGAPARETVQVRLRRRGEGAWAGVAIVNGAARAVTLRRSASAGTSASR
jgi:hypothetical protein